MIVRILIGTGALGGPFGVVRLLRERGEAP